MATIKRHLDDISKLVQQQQKSPEKQLEEIEKELKDFKEFNFTGATQREKELIEAREIIQKHLHYNAINEEIKEKKYNSFIDKELKKEIESSLFDELLDYFKQFEDKKKIYNILNKSNVKNLIIEEYKKTYGNEFIIFLYDIYNKLLNKIKNIYIEDIKEQEEEERQQKQAIKDYNRRRKEKQKNRIAFNVGVIGLLALANKNKKKW